MRASSSRLMLGVILTPRHPAEASTNTANIKLNPDRSFMNRGITFDRRCPSGKLLIQAVVY